MASELRTQSHALACSDDTEFNTWFSDLKRIAVEEFGFLQSGVDQWNPKGWKTFFAFGIPAGKALRCMIEFDYGLQGMPPLSGDSISAGASAVNESYARIS